MVVWLNYIGCYSIYLLYRGEIIKLSGEAIHQIKKRK